MSLSLWVTRPSGCTNPSLFSHHRNHSQGCIIPGCQNSNRVCSSHQKDTQSKFASNNIIMRKNLLIPKYVVCHMLIQTFCTQAFRECSSNPNFVLPSQNLDPRPTENRPPLHFSQQHSNSEHNLLHIMN